MHSATANGPLLLACVRWLLDALPRPAYWSLLKATPASKAPLKQGLLGTCLLCREVPSPCSLPWRKGLWCQGRRASAKERREDHDRGMFPTVPYLVGSCSVPGNAGAQKMTKAMVTHLGEELTVNSTYPLCPSLLHRAVQYANKPDDQRLPALRKCQGGFTVANICLKGWDLFFSSKLEVLKMF